MFEPADFWRAVVRYDRLVLVAFVCISIASATRLVLVASDAQLPRRLALLADALTLEHRETRRRSLRAALVSAVMSPAHLLPTFARLVVLWSGVITLASIEHEAEYQMSCSAPPLISNMLVESWSTVLGHAAFGIGLGITSIAVYVVLEHVARRVARERFGHASPERDSHAQVAASAGTVLYDARVAVLAALSPILVYAVSRADFDPTRAIRAEVGCSSASFALHVGSDHATWTNATGDVVAVVESEHFERMVPVDTRELWLRIDDGTTYEEVIRMLDRLYAEPSRKVCLATSTSR